MPYPNPITRLLWSPPSQLTAPIIKNLFLHLFNTTACGRRDLGVTILYPFYRFTLVNGGNARGTARAPPARSTGSSSRLLANGKYWLLIRISFSLIYFFDNLFFLNIPFKIILCAFCDPHNSHVGGLDLYQYFIEVKYLNTEKNISFIFRYAWMENIYIFFIGINLLVLIYGFEKEILQLETRLSTDWSPLTIRYLYSHYRIEIFSSICTYCDHFYEID